jgi:hypothetical protein
MALSQSLTPARSFPHFNSLTYPSVTPTPVAVAGNVTYTPAQVLSGMITRDTAGGARTDTFPTAAQMVAGLSGCAVGTTVEVFVRNDGAATLTIGAGTGGTLSGTATVATLNAKVFWLRFTNVTIGSEAYSLYSLGSFVF